VRQLDEAVISLSVAAIEDDDTPLGQPAGEPLVFRGSRAPGAAAHRPLAGQLHEHVLESAALGWPGPSRRRSWSACTTRATRAQRGPPP
jgi:hypothetical protein